jgi:prolyl 4-hydroxylase
MCTQVEGKKVLQMIQARVAVFWISLLTSHLLVSSQTCSEDGVCVAQDDVVIPKYANKDGKPVEASDDCYDRHEQCNNFVKHGECTKNPGWMIINCPLGCHACHLRDSNVRCHRDSLNTSETRALVPGQLNQIFERIALNENHQFGDIEILSRDPWIIVFNNFLTPEETDAMIRVVTYWERSTDTGQMNKFGETGRILSQGRTSSNSWCRADCEANPHVRAVTERIEYTTTVASPNFESFQILRYELGQMYNAHHDTGLGQFRLACGARILTFFLYLSDVEEGGETAFPHLNLAVKPQRGKAVLWPGVFSDNPDSIDSRTLHEARPVVRGVKFAANTWIHQYDFKTANLWGCTGTFD